MLVDAIMSFLKFLYEIWFLIPDEHKDKMKKAAEEALEPHLRKYYQSERRGETA